MQLDFEKENYLQTPRHAIDTDEPISTNKGSERAEK